MSNLKNYLGDNLSEVELELISERMINAKLERDKRREWANQLQQEYGLIKPPPPKVAAIKKYRFHLMAIAASLLVLLSAFFVYEAFSSPPFAKIVDEEIENLNIMSDQSIFRKGEEEINNLRKQANMAC